MNKQGEKNRESEARVGMVGGIGYEAFGKLVEGNGNRGLQTYREESICRDVVMVGMRMIGGMGMGLMGMRRVCRYGTFAPSVAEAGEESGV